MADNLPPKFGDDPDDTKVIKLDDDSSLQEARQAFKQQSQVGNPGIATPGDPGMSDDFDPEEQFKRLRLVAFAALVLALMALLAAIFLSSSGGNLSPSEIPDGSITGSKIAADSIDANDLSAAAQRALQGPEGPRGPAGKDGANIVGNFKLEIIETDSVSSSAVSKKGVAQCPSGTKLLSGGATITGGDDVFISNSGPVVELNDKAQKWRASAESLSVSNKQWVLTVTAICYKPSSDSVANNDTAPDNSSPTPNSQPISPQQGEG